MKTKHYIRLIGILLVGYGTAGLFISEIPGFVGFGWFEVVVALILGFGALWIGFRPSLHRESLRAARVYGVSSLGMASYGLWKPFIQGVTFELPEIVLFALIGILGLVVYFRETPLLDVPD